MLEQVLDIFIVELHGGAAGEPDYAYELRKITALEARADLFHYAPPETPNTLVWHLNFAHHHLFVAYGGGLMAQDELQVAEHPALGSLREALVATSAVLPLTVERGQPTPITIPIPHPHPLFLLL